MLYFNLVLDNYGWHLASEIINVPLTTKEILSLPLEEEQCSLDNKKIFIFLPPYHPSSKFPSFSFFMPCSVFDACNDSPFSPTTLVKIMCI